MGKWRRLGAPGGIALAAGLLVAGVVVVARSAPVAQPSLPGLRAPDFSRDAAARPLALRPELLAQSFAAGVLARLFPPAPAERTPPARSGSPAPAKASGKSGPVATSPPVDHGIVTNTLARGAWTLRLEFSAEQPVVAPGHDIVYTLRARNLGPGTFTGRVDLRSHVPLLTSYAADPVCAIQTFIAAPASPADACPLPSLPVPAQFQDLDIAGQPVPFTGLTWSTDTTIPPGGALVRTFRVTASAAAAGRDIVNHAHISLIGSAPERSSDVSVHIGDAVVPQ